jgi:hypothetical protein
MQDAQTSLFVDPPENFVSKRFTEFSDGSTDKEACIPVCRAALRCSALTKRAILEAPTYSQSQALFKESVMWSHVHHTVLQLPINTG